MPIGRENLIQTLDRMRNEYQKAIREGRHTELIRSQGLINILHEFVIKELQNIVNRDWIITEKTVYGFPKKKQQDILVQPPQDTYEMLDQLKEIRQKLRSEKKGLDMDKKGKLSKIEISIKSVEEIIAKRKKYSSIAVGPLLSINVRSQLSSIEKNYDTLFERIFAEALNLHNRFPYMVLGYLYLLPHIGYDSEAAKSKRIALTEQYDVEKYIWSFLSISGRKDPTDVPWKYERVCLLIVDFSKGPPEIIDDMEQLAQIGLVSERFARMYSFEELSINNFFDELYKLMMARYYLLIKGD